MIKNIFALLIIIFCVGLAEAKTTIAESLRFQVGHHDIRALELLERKSAKSSSLELRYYTNKNLSGGRALTKQTYDQIRKDWDKILPEKKGGVTCVHPIVITKTKLDGVKVQNECSESWSQAKQKSFNKFYDGLVALATNKKITYK